MSGVPARETSAASPRATPPPHAPRPAGGARVPRWTVAASLAVTAVLVWSGIGPYQRDVWLLEVSPVIVGTSAMALLWRRFPWTPVAVALVTAFSIVICVGGHYTYALVPAGFEVQELLGLARNPYDRLGHVMQGMVPALLARELLRRRLGLPPGAALFWICASIALSISAAYELFEWWTALLVDPEAGTAFLAMQGDPWDTQWDMALALAGAVSAQLLLGRLHERQLAALAQRPA